MENSRLEVRSQRDHVSRGRGTSVETLDQLRRQLQELAESIGRQWADDAAKVINREADRAEQRLVDLSVELYENLCREFVAHFRRKTTPANLAIVEQDIERFV